MNPLDWSLIAGPLPVILLVSALLALAWLTAGRNVRWLAIWVPLIVLAAAGLVAFMTWLINNVWRPFPDLLPFTIVFWSWVALAGLVLAFARQPLLRSWPRRAAAIVAGVLVLAAAANQVNGYFQAYPSLRAVLGPWLDPKPMFTRTANVAEVVARPSYPLASIWRPPPGMPKTGAVYQVNIPGIRSGFAARPGYIYLPPAYLATPRPQLPVLVLLAGQPGGPRQWIDSGRIQATMDAFARHHEGLAPVVLMPDDLGSEFANPLCMNSRLGDVQTYLTVDVPNWIITHLQVRPPARGWAVGGFSEGGTCAIQLATQAPRLYPIFVDISGQLEPTLGSRRLTISRAFGGNAAAYARVNPIAVLASSRFPHDAGVFVGGVNDSVYTPQQRRMFLAARHAGMQVTFLRLPGGHSWRVWRGGLERNVAWLAARLSITELAR
jgi:S-formylglutathione hydrolase FrmB